MMTPNFSVNLLSGLLVIGLVSTGCSSSRTAQSANTPSEVNTEPFGTTKDTTEDSTEYTNSSSEASTIRLTYRNERGNIELNLNPFDTEMVVMISGIKPLPDQNFAGDSTGIGYNADSRTNPTGSKMEPTGNGSNRAPATAAQAAQAGNANNSGTSSRPVENEFQRSLRLLLEAQSFFYQEDYAMAIERLDASLALQEAADSYALKALSHFMLEQYDETRQAWANALQINPDLDTPNIVRFREVIQEVNPQ